MDLALADAFDERRERNAAALRRLVQLLAAALVSLLIETTGLALAAALSS